MSEYWKSVPRKFCEFCKCWITDNKPSVDFHERGKRHKENVELRLKEVRKKSLQQSRDDDQIKAQMEKMEQAALEAFKKDLKDNPELAAQYGVSLEPKPVTAPAEKDTTSSPSTGDSVEGSKKKKKKKKIPTKEWYEAVTPEGYSYYWSTVTGESKWETPEDYLSIAEQKAQEAEEKEAKAAKSTSSKAEKTETSATQSSTKQDHNSRQSAATASSGAPSSSQIATATPQVQSTHARSAFGGWEVVKEVERPHVYDETSEAPALEEIPLPVPQTEAEEPKEKKAKVIQEKIVTLGTSSSKPVAFKKRKIGGARNVRQKTDDD